MKKELLQLSNLCGEIFFSELLDELDFREYTIWVITHEIAHCFLIVLDYIYTGNNQELFNIKEILDSLLILAIEADLSFYWIVIRLLRIMLDNFISNSLWTVLQPIINDTQMLDKYIYLLSRFKFPVIELWPSQMSSIELATGENRGGVINLRTSGGKTRVSEIAILKTLAENNTAKILYIAPFRSLAFEIEQTFEKSI